MSFTDKNIRETVNSLIDPGHQGLNDEEVSSLIKMICSQMKVHHQYNDG